MTDKSEINEATAAVVNSILLMRIYDVVWLMLAATNPEWAANVAETHERGEFIGPNPSVSQDSSDDSSELRQDGNSV